jgi:tetratricopeptide (TPR) repeat protein
VRHGATEQRARIENGLGVVHHARGEYAQARACYGVALELTADVTQRGRVMLNLGAIANIEGDLENARSYYIRSRALFAQSGFARGQASALHNLGMLDADEERWDEADEAYRQCLELLEELGDRQMIANVLVNRSELECSRVRFDDAIANCDLALTIYAEIGDGVGRGEALRWKGHALRQVGQYAEAERALIEAAQVARHAQVKLLEAEALRDLGLSRVARNETAEALKALRRSLSLFEHLGAQREITAVAAEIGKLQ